MLMFICYTPPTHFAVFRRKLLFDQSDYYSLSPDAWMLPVTSHGLSLIISVTTLHFCCVFFSHTMSVSAQTSQCVHVPVLLFRRAEVSLVLSKQTVEASSFCLDRDVEMMSLFLLYLLLEPMIIILHHY